MSRTTYAEIGRWPRRALLAAAFLGAVTAHAQSRTPHVVLVAGGLRGQFYQCLDYYMKQGLPMRQAVQQCQLADLVAPVGNGAFGADLFGGGSSPMNSSGVDCPTVSADPRASGIVHRDPMRPPGWNYNVVPGRNGAFERNYQVLFAAYEAMMEGMKEEAEALTKAAEQAKSEQAKAEAQARAAAAWSLVSRVEAKAMMDWYYQTLSEHADWSKEHPASEPGDYVVPDPDPTPTVRPGPGQVDMCQDLAQFISDCNAVGWQSGQCQIFLAQLNHCADPTIALTDGEGGGCGAPRVGDEEQAKRVAFVVCNQHIKPAPGHDPCSEGSLEGEVYEFALRRDPNGPPCENPYAMPDDEACSRTVSVVVTLQDSADEIVRLAQERLGGPVFIVPKPATPPPHPGGPDPVPPRP